MSTLAMDALIMGTAFPYNRGHRRKLVDVLKRRLALRHRRGLLPCVRRERLQRPNSIFFRRARLTRYRHATKRHERIVRLRLSYRPETDTNVLGRSSMKTPSS